ncbi:MAG: hypothetical protein K2O14_02705 [Oscillospiraceae bacterium]|nr:hypothetical protein [Oscillospiraceae bacterium]
MNKSRKAFLRNALILTAALAVVIIFMEEWGAAQILIVALVAILAAGQWLLFALLDPKKKK